MATFTPPTHKEYFAPPKWDRLWSRVPYQRGDAVLVEDGTATRFQVVDGDRFKAAETYPDYAFTGGHTYTDIFGDAEIALEALGFGDGGLLTGVDWPAWL